eukprot:189666_1
MEAVATCDLALICERHYKQTDEIETEESEEDEDEDEYEYEYEDDEKHDDKDNKKNDNKDNKICKKQIYYKWQNESLFKIIHSPISLDDIKKQHYNVSNIHNVSSNLTLLRSNKLIDINISKQLIKLIKPLQNNKYNYRNKQFVNSLINNSEKPKLQELIYQFAHYEQYKQLKSLMNRFEIISDNDSDDSDNNNDNITTIKVAKDYKMPIGLAPTIFDLKTNKFITEINGLSYDNNIKLYS